MTATAPARRRYSFRDYLNRRVLIMLVLGLSSGLPFMLVSNTLGFWLRDQGVGLSAISFITGVSIAYSLKFLWAPVLDRVRAPLLGMLGRRRGWLVLAQVLVGTGLAGMGALGMNHGIGVLTAAAALVAFAGATQDILIDAWRIESASGPDELGLLVSAYTFGYRAALIATEAVILAVAQWAGWSFAYVLYGAAMVIGLIATLLAAEPGNADAVMSQKETQLPLWTARGFYDAVAGPFIVFFKTHGRTALLMLVAIALYRLPDFAMGPMANPFYHDLGISKLTVAATRGSVSLAASLLGVTAGGVFALRFGYMRALLAGGVLQGLAIAAYAALTLTGGNEIAFAAVMAGDSFAISFAGLSLVAYMSSLTSLGYTASQYALLSSAYAWVGKVSKLFSGSAIEALTPHLGLMNAYAVFFLGCGAIGIPSLLLFVLLARRQSAAAGKPS